MSTLDQAKEAVTAATNQVERTRVALLQAINRSWMARVAEITELAITDQPEVANALDDDQLRQLKADLQRVQREGPRPRAQSRCLVA